MSDKKKDLNELTIQLPAELSETIAEKVKEELKSAYYWNVSAEIAKAVLSKMQDTGFIDRIVNSIYNQLILEETEFVDAVSKNLKDSLLECVSVISNETVKEVSKKIKSFGFIRIGG